jgi:succinoglycan biosynthesis protein ExoO
MKKPVKNTAEVLIDSAAPPQVAIHSATRPLLATIVVPNYCAEATLGRALRSALNQTLRDIEIIVVDDASTDGSWGLINSLVTEDSRVVAMRNDRNCGKPVGMNRAIALARGRWLAVLDADDWYHPERLARMIAVGERRHADLVADNQFFFDAQADRLVGTAWRAAESHWPLSFDHFLYGSNAYATFNLGMLKPVIRTDFIRRAALGYEEDARHGQDFFHMLQFYLAGGRAIVTDQPLYYYTQPFGAVSRRWSHATRRRYDFETAYRINRRQITAAQDVLTVSQVDRLEQRNNQLRALELYYQAKECFFDGDYVGAVRRIARQPALLRYAAWRLRKRLLRYPDSKPIERVATLSRRHYAPTSIAAPTQITALAGDEC